MLREDGIKEHVFLLDEQLKIEGVGLISQNLAEKLVSGITELSYRECAKKVSETTGQTIYLAKILAKKCSGRLGEVADKLRCSGFRSNVIEELKEKAMSAATSPSKDGKGYEYAVQGRLAMLSNKLRGSREIWLKLAGF